MILLAQKPVVAEVFLFFHLKKCWFFFLFLFWLVRTQIAMTS